MASRGLPGLWLRGVTAAGACLLALGSTGAVVTAGVVAQSGSAPMAVLTSHGDEGKADGLGSGVGTLKHKVDDAVNSALATLKAGHPVKTPKPEPTPKADPTAKPKPHPTPPPHKARPAAAASNSHPNTPDATPKVVVDTSDPAPFSAQAVSATEAARVLPVESLGPLSGISFGSGLFIWPVLLAVDVLALAVIARMALRRRFVAEN